MCKIFLRIKNNHFFKTKCVENQVIMSKSNQFTHIYVKIRKQILINSFESKKGEKKNSGFFYLRILRIFAVHAKILTSSNHYIEKTHSSILRCATTKIILTFFLVFVLCWLFSLKRARTKQNNYHFEECIP